MQTGAITRGTPGRAPAPSARSRSLIGRLAGCMSVSVITTTFSWVMLAVLVAGVGMQAWVANVVTTAVATIPSYVLNRRWVWQKQGQSDVWREVVPFWALSFAGLILSTIFVAMADAWAVQHHLATGARTVFVLGANLAGFGVLWVVQFIVLDRVLFAGRTPVHTELPL